LNVKRERETKADATTAAARAIIDAKRSTEAAKTERLRKARIERDAADLLAHESASTRTSKGKRQPKRKD
jgi:hypothetical protein